MSELNTTICKKIWLDGSNDFQQRVPEPTQQNMAGFVRSIFNYQPHKNWFVHELINRVGLTYVHNRRWENPLTLFKRDSIQFGDTIQEIATSMLKAKGYEIDAQTLLQINRPTAKCAYHTENRRDRYMVTVNDLELRKAFLQEYGLNEYVASVMNSMYNSDQYDEYQIMKNLIAQYESTYGGFYKIHVDDVIEDATGATAKTLLKYLKAFNKKLKFPSVLYNKAGYDQAFSNPEDLVLITTPEIEAAIDVDALAVLFHIDKAEIKERIVIVDEFPIAGAQALLVDKDWFVCGDTINVESSFYNAETLSTNFWLHHWGIYSTSPFMNAILFTTEEGTSVGTSKVTVDSVKIEYFKKDEFTYKLVGKAFGTATNDSEGEIKIPGSALVYSITGTLNNKGVNIGQTYIDRDNVLHVDRSLEAGTVLTIVGVSSYINPSGLTPTLEDQIEIEVGTETKLTLNLSAERQTAVLFGQEVSAIQSADSKIVRGKFKGTSYANEAFHCHSVAIRAEATPGATVNAKMVGGSNGSIDLDEDKNILVKIDEYDPSSPITEVIFTATLNDASIVKKVNLKDVVLDGDFT